MDFGSTKTVCDYGNKNVITYKDVFPLLSNNEIWLGPGFPGGNAFFKIANKCVRNFADGVYDDDTGLVKFRNVGWFTNIDHGKRHKNLILDTMEHNLKFNKKLKNKLEKEYGKLEYPHYDNYDAIEVPFTECIPSDYDGVMGVPITFLDKYNPDQFDIVALGNSRDNFTPNKDYVNPKKIMRNGDIKNGNAINCVLAINCCMKPADIYYIADNADYLTAPYARVLICAKRNK